MNYKTKVKLMLKNKLKVKQILNFLDELYSFNGKIGRKFYATRMLALVIITPLSFFLLGVLSSALLYISEFFGLLGFFSGFFGLLGLMLYGLHIYGWFGLQVRRMRDLGWSTNWLILYPFFGLIMIVLFLLKSGVDEE